MTAGDEGVDPDRAGRPRDSISEALAAAADQLAGATAPAPGSLAEIKEKHLSEAVKKCLRAKVNRDVLTKKVGLAEWPRVGPVDIVVFADRVARPRHVMELKWCTHDKLHEAIWDLFKVALLTRLESVETGVLVTGAPSEMWATAFCRDIFEGGTFDPDELCARRFPGSNQKLVWDWLLEGGYDNAPTSVPAPIETRTIGRWEVSDGQHRSEIRAVSVHAEAEDVPFFDGWPRGDRPEGAKHPLRSEVGDLHNTGRADSARELRRTVDELEHLARPAPA